jgi:hypothetical protein
MRRSSSCAPSFHGTCLRAREHAPGRCERLLCLGVGFPRDGWAPRTFNMYGAGSRSPGSRGLHTQWRSFWSRHSSAFVSAASAAGTAVFGWATRLVVTCTIWPQPLLLHFSYAAGKVCPSARRLASDAYSPAENVRLRWRALGPPSSRDSRWLVETAIAFPLGRSH